MSEIQVIPSGEFEIVKRTKTAFYVRLDKKTVLCLPISLLENAEKEDKESGAPC